MADMNQIAKKLLERTDERRIPWKSTVNPNSFSAMVGNLSVMVSMRPTPISALPISGVYKLAVLDEKGIELESLVDDSPVGNALLRSLHESARRSARGIDERLEELLANLDAT